ncbi:MAG: SRPBCC domain-containing protein [Solirubrobacteraceae bacterium]
MTPIRIERRLSHPIERVWRAVTEPAEMARWFVVEDIPWTPREGEEFEAGGQPGRITELRPPHRFAWEWSVESYAFELAVDGDGTLLVFTHVFNPEHGPQEQHERGWGIYLARLDAHLDGGFLSEEDAHRQADG